MSKSFAFTDIVKEFSDNLGKKIYLELGHQFRVKYYDICNIYILNEDGRIIFSLYATKQNTIQLEEFSYKYVYDIPNVLKLFTIIQQSIFKANSTFIKYEEEINFEA